MNNKNTEKLLELIKNNPELPVVTMVDSDVVADDCGRWMGKFGVCEVGEYALYDDKYFDDRDSFKEAYYDFNDDELCEKFKFNPRITEYSVARGEYDAKDLIVNNNNEKALDTYLDEIADKYFTKAIIVNVDLPDA